MRLDKIEKTVYEKKPLEIPWKIFQNSNESAANEVDVSDFVLYTIRSGRTNFVE